ncbi:MAG: hypothetical protein V2A73_10495 [Pseudomonadota bacterium]
MPETLLMVFDSLVERLSSSANRADIVAGRAEFVQKTGTVFEDEALFETRSAAFLEWYVVERPTPGTSRAPIWDALATVQRDDAQSALWAWATSHRSLFVVSAIADGAVLLFDLLGGSRFRVQERRRLPGVERGAVMEARLLGWQGSVRFGRTFLYHPEGVREAILAHASRIRAAGGTRSDIVDFAASLRMRAERYRHVAPARLYWAAGTSMARKEAHR